MDRNNSDFEGLTSRDYLSHSAMVDLELAESILHRIDMGERPTSAEMLFLRWHCGLSLNPPKDYRQVEMAVNGDEA